VAATDTIPVNLIDQFDSLLDATRATFPPESCRLLAMREHGDVGYALFDTRPAGEPYLYEVYYDRRDGRWSEGSSSNGPGWHLLDPDTGLGVLTDWGEAPAGAERVRVEFQGEVLEEEVVNGVHLIMWWGIPCPEGLGPRTTAFRINGQWVPMLQ